MATVKFCNYRQNRPKWKLLDSLSERNSQNPKPQRLEIPDIWNKVSGSSSCNLKKLQSTALDRWEQQGKENKPRLVW